MLQPTPRHRKLQQHQQQMQLHLEQQDNQPNHLLGYNNDRENKMKKKAARGGILTRFMFIILFFVAVITIATVFLHFNSSTGITDDNQYYQNKKNNVDPNASNSNNNNNNGHPYQKSGGDQELFHKPTPLSREKEEEETQSQTQQFSSNLKQLIQKKQQQQQQRQQGIKINEYMKKAFVGSYSYQDTKSCTNNKMNSQFDGDTGTGTCQIHFPMVYSPSNNYSKSFGNHKIYDDNNVDSHFALLTHTGTKMDPATIRTNQDRAALIYPVTLSASEGYDTTASTTADRKRKSHTSKSKKDNDNWLMALFDGHGDMGHVVSQQVTMEFQQYFLHTVENLLLQEKIKEQPLQVSEQQRRQQQQSTSINDNSMNAADIIGNAIFQNTTDVQNIEKIVAYTLWNTFKFVDEHLPRFLITSGCTGIAMFKYDQKLYIANVGDSTAFVFKTPKKVPTKNSNNNHHNKDNTINTKIIYQTQPHKPDDPIEKRRIESNGGIVQPKPKLLVNGTFVEVGTSRVLIPWGNPMMMQQMGLAMSRSFGDFEGKSKSQNFVSNEPTIDILDLKNQKKIQTPWSSSVNTITSTTTTTTILDDDDDDSYDYYAVITSDGVVDHVSPQEIANDIVNWYSRSDSNNNKHDKWQQQQTSLLHICSDLITKAIGGWKQSYLTQQRQFNMAPPPDNNFHYYRDDISIAVVKLQM